MTNFKKFEDIIKERENLQLQEMVAEAFEGLDEGFISNIKKLGFWKGLKLSLGKGMQSLLDYIKDNKKLQQDIGNYAKKFGSEAMDDMGEIMGNTVKRYQDEIDALKDKMEDLEKKAKKA